MGDTDETAADKKRLDLALILAAAAAFIIAIGAVTGLTLDRLGKVHEGYAEYQKNADRIEESTKQDMEQSCFLTEFTAYSKCIREKLSSYSKAQAANQDLEAQKDMAWWALTLFVLGVVQTFIGLVGIWYVKENLSAVRKSLVEMQKARNISQAALTVGRAANDQTERLLGIEKKRTEKELRAYVLVESVGLKWVNSKKYVPKLYVQSKNFGQTPAGAVRINFNFVFSATEKGAVFNGIEKPSQFPRTGLILGPGAEKFSFLSINGEKRLAWAMGMAGVKTDTLTLYVVGQITYIDTITRAPRDTVFKFRYVKDAGKIVDTKDFSACESDNYFT